MMEIPDAMSGDDCDSIISLFEKRTDLHYKGQTSNGANNRIDTSIKEDTEILTNEDLFNDTEWSSVLSSLVKAIGTSVDEYKEKFSDGNKIGIDSLRAWQIEQNANIQRFYPGQGFKKWHCESGSREFSARVLVWMLYLNTVTDKGGTEFYFQDKTFKAEKGKMVIWPPFWTHFHRSEVSPTQTKYIITGWFEFS